VTAATRAAPAAYSSPVWMTSTKALLALDVQAHADALAALTTGRP
jgi:hypothetical protein